MSEIERDGVRISYDVAGDGPGIVLLHGWSLDRRWFHLHGFVRQLEVDHRVVAIDLRGSGQSSKPLDPEAHLWSVLVEDVVAVADAEGLEKFAVWGQSYGGMVAWMCAHTHPDRVTALVTTGWWDPAPWPHEDWVDWREDLDVWREGGMPALLGAMRSGMGDRYGRAFPPSVEAMVLEQDPEALSAMMVEESRHEGVRDLTGFPVPVMLIAGDLEDDENEIAQVAALVPRGESLRLTDRGHGDAAADSAATVPAVRAFLGRHDW